MQIAVIVINYLNEVCMHSCHNAVQAKCAVLCYVCIVCATCICVCYILSFTLLYIYNTCIYRAYNAIAVNIPHTVHANRL